MASVKVSAHSLEQQKKEYEKAVKNLDNALEQIKKVNASLGKDAMLDGVRQALTKLAASLETRAGVILLMTKALEQSNAKYTAAQKKAVTKSNQFRAHNRDFYGNPVVVTVVAGGAGATAGALTGAAAVAETTGTTPAASNVASGTVTDASNAVSGTGGSVHIKSQGTVNVSSQTDSDIRQAVYTQRGPSATIAQVSEHARNVAAPKAADSLTDIPEKETVAMASEIPEPGSAPAVTGAAVTGAAVTGAFAAGAAAAGAAIGSIAGGSIKRIKQPEPFTKEKKPDPSTDIEAQLEAARERLRRFNEMEMEEKE
ncbi:hypothetical protein WMO41_13790 [Ventrimonas sp. CLA-AP-H27]|uniref:Uncharacterized protein n=1 Tax=Ventrimonas faecis TaxID=3133170 RepID=A0ABV1HPI8_9FIRM